ncbi:uncharacterized protein FA14DRAFT_159220 [Meira miltonrushii]|uniref:Heparinase II/III-like C-terminal domain-containing protein n=1 Tax=Meira miltonrushii TaxID=1280837 RepID=A0A316VH28_9BASI|nr:uncharacterized protein FA14DRAFT_159220 [Meira miltonrushii]PWN36949.1 hypothetical protein FA14DRAFT_159220 [Meira miltonrushii]
MQSKGSEIGSNYGDHQYVDFSQQGSYNQQPYGAGGAGAAGYGAGQGAAYKDYSSSAHNLTGGAPAANAQKYSYAPSKKPVSKWIKIGIPVVLIIIAIGVGVGLGIGLTRGDSSAHSSTTATNGLSGATSGNEPSYYPENVLNAASAAAKSGGGDDLTYQGTDLYGNPSFKSSANTAAATLNSAAIGNCAADNFNGSLTNLRPHPRIMTTAAEWDCLPNKIANDAYLTVWNYTIFQNASAWYAMPPTKYVTDGGIAGSGILDPAREVQLRVKTFAYAYHLSGNDTKWRDRAWDELYAASGNDSANPWGAGNPPTQVWNPTHFLDLAELTAAFAIGYDWLYYAWTPQQRTALAWSIVTQGLQNGVQAYQPKNEWSWWQTTNGNWNCVCNSGLLLGALALGSEDPSGTAATNIIANTIPNMKGNCMQAVYDDGTWTETANYWYFGTDALARAYSALMTATGSDQGLMASNPNWPKTGDFHMYVSGNAGMFYYGDNGPNKYSTNANGMFLWGTIAQNPSYALFQRDRADAPDPLSMFWYDTRTKGGFWNGQALDQYFNNDAGTWGSMRSSWTDFSGTYVAMKSSNATGHQTHGDLDAGDFVIDALGTRWAGEFGSANYLSTDYFKSEAQDAVRWEYYRKGTQGQNTIVLNKANQAASCKPVNTFLSTNTTQSGDITFTPASTDTALFVTDMSSCYNTSASTVVRGIRFLNGRRQVLLRDEIASNSAITDINWRVHTNATITLSSDKKTATLTLQKLIDPNAYGGDYQTGPSTLTASLPEQQTMVVQITQPSNAQFAVIKPDETRLYGTDPNTAPGEQGDQPNPTVSLLYIELPGGSQTTIETIWQPKWPKAQSGDDAAPKEVPLNQWSLTSHN